MKSYLLSFSLTILPEEMYETLNKTSAVATWVSPFPYSAIVLSNLTLNELTAVLHTHLYTTRTWFLLIEATPDNCSGWLPAQFWEYVNNPAKAWTTKLFAELAKAPSALPSSSKSEPPSYLDYWRQDKKK